MFRFPPGAAEGVAAGNGDVNGVNLQQQRRNRTTLESTFGRLVANDAGLTEVSLANMDDSQVRRLATALQNNSMVQSVALDQLRIRSPDPVLALVRNSPALLRLQISRSSGEALAPLFRALSWLHQEDDVEIPLESLVLLHNPSAGALVWGRHLSALMEANRTLKVLCVVQSGVHNNTLKEIVQGLAKNSSLKELTLHQNYIWNDVTEALARTLTVNRCLRSVKMNSQYMRNSGLIALVDALRQNETLHTLELHNCDKGVDYRGVTYLGKALPEIKGLKVLRITGSIYFSMDLPAWEALVSGLLWNTALDVLRVECGTFEGHTLWNLYKDQLEYLLQNKEHRAIVYDKQLRDSLWPHVFARADATSPNAFMLYHYLREKPDLVRSAPDASD